MATAGEGVRGIWERRWEEGTTSWHREKVSDVLSKYLKDLTENETGVSILVTWCGKSVDLPWLCQEGYNVVGVELSVIAAKQMFEENGIPYTVTRKGEFVVYQASDRKLKIFSGNFYKFSPEIAGTFEAVWDNNAFGAAEPEDRDAYQEVLLSLLKPNGRVLLTCFEYGDQQRMQAPFSIPPAQLKDVFQDNFDVQFLEYLEEFIPFILIKFKFDWAKNPVHLLCLK